MNKKKIKAEIIADSTNKHGQRITTFVLTYPRIIHAELLTHRLFSRNAASSRAIPAIKMIKDIQEDPFIPVAWQKAHKGMQGTEYFEDPEAIDYVKHQWNFSMREVIARAKVMNETGVTKQIINRTLEPYQWYTCIVTATEFDNFFELRCPQYEWDGQSFKSRKDCLDFVNANSPVHSSMNTWDDLAWLKINKGAGEIHISLLAEAMWDATNESEPNQLKAGEWHIPFGDKFDKNRVIETCIKAGPENLGYISQSKQETEATVTKAKVKIATARCARVSYLNFEGKDDYEADLKLFQRLYDMKHMSPFEHCARAMSGAEMIDYRHLVRGKQEEQGWSGNFRGFVQLRKEIE
jgi:thymidylate synthase ThyX